MTDYYLIPDADAFSDNAGTATGTAYTGPAGLQAAIRGTGNATALAPGDTLWIKAGTGNLSRLVLIDCNGTDVTATGIGWAVGDAVEDAMDGELWNGVIVETNDGGFLGADDMLLIWLASGLTETDVIYTAGVRNTTQSETVTPLADNTSTPGVYLEADGTTAAYIKFVGVNSSWVEDGTQPIFDGADKAVSMFGTTSNTDYYEFRNIHNTQFTQAAWCHGSNDMRYSSFINCTASESAGGFGNQRYMTNCFLNHCLAYNNTTNAYRLSYGQAVNCVSYNNLRGFFLYRATLANCVAFENTVGVYAYLGPNAMLVNCVLDKNGDGVEINGSGVVNLEGCRITGNTTYGIKGTALAHDPYCFYSGNGTNFQTPGVIDDTIRGVSTRVTSGTIGYIDNDDATPNADRNYGLTNSATSRRQEVTL